ncbi:MAG: hypothetical protein ACHQFW_11750 [Chitinophagales bacterium]
MEAIVSTPVDAVQVIQKVEHMSGRSPFLASLGNGVLFLFEVICYLVLIALIGLAIWLPGGGITTDTVILNTRITLNNDLTVDKLFGFYTTLKITVVVLGLLLLIPAFLFRNIRMKNKLIREVHALSANYLKSNNIGRI